MVKDSNALDLEKLFEHLGKEKVLQMIEKII